MDTLLLTPNIFKKANEEKALRIGNYTENQLFNTNYFLLAEISNDSGNETGSYSLCKLIQYRIDPRNTDNEFCFIIEFEVVHSIV